MSISTINQATPDNDDPAGLGAAQIRALKAAIVSQFAGEAGDLWDTPLTVGPRALNLINTLASDAELAAVESRVSVNELAIVSQANTFTDLDSRTTVLEAIGPSDYANAAWPVGSLFISADGGTPAAKGIPGTWSAIGTNRFLIGGSTGEAGDTGGANSYALSENQLPAHNHKMFDDTQSSTEGLTPSSIVAWRGDYGSNRTYSMARVNGGSAVHGRTANTGSGSSIDNRPAYLKVVFYQRTA